MGCLNKINSDAVKDLRLEDKDLRLEYKYKDLWSKDKDLQIGPQQTRTFLEDN